jgi:hypothetical protein
MILAGQGESSIFLVCALYLYTFVILGQGGERFFAVQLPKARDFKGILEP